VACVGGCGFGTTGDCVVGVSVSEAVSFVLGIGVGVPAAVVRLVGGGVVWVLLSTALPVVRSAGAVRVVLVITASWYVGSGGLGWGNWGAGGVAVVVVVNGVAMEPRGVVVAAVVVVVAMLRLPARLAW